MEALEVLRANSEHCTMADLEPWRCTRADLEPRRRHKEFGRAAVVHIEDFGPCKCSIIVDVLVCSPSVLN